MPNAQKRADWNDVILDPHGVAHDVLNRMRSSHECGRGMCLTAAELHALSVTQVGDYWTQDDPRLEASQP